MKLLHTKEEIIKFENLSKLANELSILDNKYSAYTNVDELNQLSQHYLKIVQSELDKYAHLIGQKVIAPPSRFTASKEKRPGIITKITHFNTYSGSVRGTVKYDSDGYDCHSLKELELIID